MGSCISVDGALQGKEMEKRYDWVVKKREGGSTRGWFTAWVISKGGWGVARGFAGMEWNLLPEVASSLTLHMASGAGSPAGSIQDPSVIIGELFDKVRLGK